MVPLSQDCEFVVKCLFKGGLQQAEAKLLLLNDCGDDLPLYRVSSPSGYDRIRFAVSKLSGGDLGRLKTMIQLAKTDWRDALCAADFAEDIRAHEDWLKSLKASN
jgi:hypothetical protein